MTEVGTFLFDEAIYSIDVSPYDCHLFVTAGEDGTVQLCDIRNSHGKYLFVKNLFLFIYFI